MIVALTRLLTGVNVIDIQQPVGAIFLLHVVFTSRDDLHWNFLHHKLVIIFVGVFRSEMEGSVIVSATCVFVYNVSS